MTQTKKSWKRYFWIFFIIVGLLHFLPAINSFCILCREPGHWDWLTRDAEVLDYLSFVWQLVSLFQAGLSLVMMVVAAMGYRRGEKWAWLLLWLWLPVLVGEAILAPWMWPIYAVLMGIMVLGQLWTRSFFHGDRDNR
jgi:hypothetical protein